MRNKNILIKEEEFILKMKFTTQPKVLPFLAHFLQNKLQRTLDYPVCGISLRDHKLLMTNNEGETQRDLATDARTKSSRQQSGSFMHQLCMYYIYYN